MTNPGYKPKPKEDSPKFPATSTSTAPEKPDSESKILDAYFVNGKNQKLTKAAVGNHVQVQIITRNMLGKHVQYKVWEYDTAKNDLVYESGRIEVKGDIINTSGFTLTQAIFDKGIDFGRLDPDSSSQNYFIEVLPLDVSAESKRFGVTAEALMTVETGKSAAVVREEPRAERKEEKECPNCDKDITLEEIKQIFPRSGTNEKLAQKLIDELNTIKLNYGIDTCLKKAHMVTQMGSETEFRTLREELDGYSVNTLKMLFSYFKRHPDEAVTYQGNIYELAIRAYGLRGVDKEEDIISCSISRIKGCNDLGNETMEDGYTYLGRGLIQLTGKYQYTLINKDFQKAFPNQGNLVNNPELLEKPKYAVMSGLSYWINNNLNDKAEKGSNGSHVDAITRIINKNLDDSHYKRRRDFFEKAKTVFKLDQYNKNGEELINSKVVIKFGENADKSVVSEKSLNILKEVGEQTKNYLITITSTARDPYNQARVMYNNIVSKGMKEQRKTYKEPGQGVLDAYESAKAKGKNKDDIIKEMEAKIKEIGPSKVSRHCGDPSVVNVFDVTQGMSNPKDFKKIITPKIKTLLDENGCYHLEIIQ